MTLPPIAVRELRVSARSKATHRMRIFFAVGAVAIAVILAIFSNPGGSLPAGMMLFTALKWIAFVFACGAGTFLTADCLSEEKREGTLGLLFLTDLRGHDVVLGKLFATSLRTFYALLAIFPVMAFSFPLGGVAAGEFWQTLLALCNALFFSLALGMAVSVLSRDPVKAMTGTLAMTGCFLSLNLDQTELYLFSPLHSLTQAGTGGSDYWWSLLLVQFECWCFLGFASLLTPRSWQERAIRSEPGATRASPLFTTRGKRNLLEKSPVCWILMRDRWTSLITRIAFYFIVVLIALVICDMPETPSSASSVTTRTTTTSNGSTTYVVKSNNMTVSSMRFTARQVWYRVVSWGSGLISLGLEFWLAAHVARFYIETKKSGFLEQLLVTPLQPIDILRGHWLAVMRLFLAPAIAQAVLMLVMARFQGWWVNPVSQGVATVLGAVTWLIGMATIAWFASWMGMTSNRIAPAVLKTYCYSQLLPHIGIGICMSLLTFLLFTPMGSSFIWIWPLFYNLGCSAVSLVLIATARFRALAAFPNWRAQIAS